MSVMKSRVIIIIKNDYEMKTNNSQPYDHAGIEG